MRLGRVGGLDLRAQRGRDAVSARAAVGHIRAMPPIRCRAATPRRTLARAVATIACVLASSFAGAAAASGAAVSAGASAEPAPITIIVPFAAGGPTDRVARALLPGLARALGEAVRVRNVGGAGGTVGATEAAQAPPDGRTLLLHHIGMATAPALYRRLPYDPQRDFAPVGRVVDVPMVLVVRAGFDASSAQDAVRAIRSARVSPLVAYAGLGAASHLCGMLLSSALGLDLIQIPYRGTGPALADLLADKVDLMCDQTTNTVGPITDGRLRGIAVTTPARLPSLPGLPTAAQVGIPDLRLSIWHGVFAPRDTPRAVLDTLARALQSALREPAFASTAAAFDARVASPLEATPAALGALLASETARWAPIIRRTGQFAD
ncbi:MAG: tripartite tricarboxylate transporter substrate-binding protein [Lautropia sp.]